MGHSVLTAQIQNPFVLVLVLLLALFTFQGHAQQSEGFILKKGEGESLLNGIVVKASPATGTENSIMVEQTFMKGGTTSLHIHDQGDELFYVVSGRGEATLGSHTKEVGFGDVIFVPRGVAHEINNLNHNEPLKVVFFMETAELVAQFRAVHEWKQNHPDQTLTPEQINKIGERIGGGRPAD